MSEPLPSTATDFSQRIYKLMRSLERHRERYLRAWMAHYRAHPADVHIVTRMNAGLEGGDVMRMEYRTDSDHVVELVKAARAAESELRGNGSLVSAGKLAAALKPFEP